MEKAGKLIAKLDAPEDGRFVAPHVFRVGGIEEMEREVFGPVLHVATFEADEIDSVIAAINRKGYGLTFGLHTRIEARVQHIVDGIHAGNIYVNRNQIGAVVGSQPFGGEGLSGTGPKAGGPHYLRRFRREVEAARVSSPAPRADAVTAARSPNRCRSRPRKAGRRCRTASPSCASICAARVLRHRRGCRARIWRSTCLARPARRTRSRSCRAVGCLPRAGRRNAAAQVIQALAAGCGAGGRSGCGRRHCSR
jgi:delta 1-pyrroline-5-carboxylate dehydrogenase